MSYCTRKVPAMNSSVGLKHGNASRRCFHFDGATCMSACAKNLTCPSALITERHRHSCNCRDNLRHQIYEKSIKRKTSTAPTQKATMLLEDIRRTRTEMIRSQHRMDESINKKSVLDRHCRRKYCTKASRSVCQLGLFATIDVLEVCQKRAVY